MLKKLAKKLSEKFVMPHKNRMRQMKYCENSQETWEKENDI